MGTTASNKLGVGIVVCVAIGAIVLSQLAFAQQRASKLQAAAQFVGTGKVGPDDARFEPAALMFVNEAANSPVANLQAGFYQTILNGDVTVRIAAATSPEGNGAKMRPLTPSEALFLEELFSHNLAGAKGLAIDARGVSGTVTSRDLRMRPGQLVQMAKARGMRKSRWYAGAAGGLGRG